jgi:hypothetical protein
MTDIARAWHPIKPGEHARANPDLREWDLGGELRNQAWSSASVSATTVSKTRTKRMNKQSQSPKNDGVG